MKKPTPNLAPVLIPYGEGKNLDVETFCKIYPEKARWMASLEHLQRNHPVVHQTILQYVQTSATPAHNAFSVRFLDPVYRVAFAEAANPGFVDRPVEILKEALQTLLTEARLDLAEACANKNVSYQELEEAQRNVRVHQQRLADLPMRSWVTTESRIEYERKGGIDVSFEVWADVRLPDDINPKDLPKPLQRISSKAICDVEIKPLMGDDFPLVLRQMKHSKAKYLYLGEYTGFGANLDQVREIFGTSNKFILTKADVDAEYRRLMGETAEEIQDDVRDLQNILD
jgi:hypothetical protein